MPSVLKYAVLLTGILQQQLSPSALVGVYIVPEHLDRLMLYFDAEHYEIMLATDDDPGPPPAPIGQHLQPWMPRPGATLPPPPNR